MICRRSPNLPHTFACSTIGPARLNFRVRDGNGWDPRGMVTGKVGGVEIFRAERSGFRLRAQTPAKTPQPERRLAGGFSRGRGIRTVSSSDRCRQTGVTAYGWPGDEERTSNPRTRKRKSIGVQGVLSASAELLRPCGRREQKLHRINSMDKPNGRLVLVSYTHYCASTSSLSTRWSSWTLQGDLILERASRLYAFSGYHNRTSLPSRAIGMTTGTQEVRPSRSSRTKDSPLQISYAHSR
jgi:hypothetical protein